MTPEQFKQARRSMGLSQAEMGKLIGLDGRTVRRYEQALSDSSSRPIPESTALLVNWLAHGKKPSEAKLWSVVPGPVRALLRWFLFGESPG